MTTSPALPVRAGREDSRPKTTTRLHRATEIPRPSPPCSTSMRAGHIPLSQSPSRRPSTPDRSARRGARRGAAIGPAARGAPARRSVARKAWRGRIACSETPSPLSRSPCRAPSMLGNADSGARPSGSPRALTPNGRTNARRPRGRTACPLHAPPGSAHRARAASPRSKSARSGSLRHRSGTERRSIHSRGRIPGETRRDVKLRASQLGVTQRANTEAQHRGPTPRPQHRGSTNHARGPPEPPTTSHLRDR